MGVGCWGLSQDQSYECPTIQPGGNPSQCVSRMILPLSVIYSTAVLANCLIARAAAAVGRCAGPRTRDPRFIYMQHGQLHIGDFNSSSTGAPPPKLDWRSTAFPSLLLRTLPLFYFALFLSLFLSLSPSLSLSLSLSLCLSLSLSVCLSVCDPIPCAYIHYRYQLQVEGVGYIRTLAHGYPLRKQGLSNTVLESVEDEPVLTSVYVLPPTYSCSTTVLE